MTERAGSVFTDPDELVGFLRRLGDAPSGEDDEMSALDHGLQCAHELSQVRPDDGELHIAGLVHDIGHQFASDRLHGAHGAGSIRALLGERVAALVEAHVPAKRYLVGTDPSYRSTLSTTSVRTLDAQGGPLSAAESRRFERSAAFSEALLLRRADDAAKVPGRQVPELDHWLPSLRAVAGANRSPEARA